LAVTLFDGDGNTLHGTTDDEQDVTAWTSDPEGGYPALEALRRSATTAHGLEQGETLAISLESPSRVVILGWTSSGRLLRLVLDSAAILAVMLGRVRRDL